MTRLVGRFRPISFCHHKATNPFSGVDSAVTMTTNATHYTCVVVLMLQRRRNIFSEARNTHSERKVRMERSDSTSHVYVHSSDVRWNELFRKTFSQIILAIMTATSNGFTNPTGQMHSLSSNESPPLLNDGIMSGKQTCGRQRYRRRQRIGEKDGKRHKPYKINRQAM